jgi:hypothetical protein
VVRCVSDGFVGANGVSPDAMDVDTVRGCTANRNAEADVRSTYVCYQSQHRGTVELFALGIRTWKRCIHCHHYPLKKDREDCSPADNAVNRLGSGFYPLINVTVVRVLQTLTPFDNAV